LCASSASICAQNRTARKNQRSAKNGSDQDPTSATDFRLSNQRSAKNGSDQDPTSATDSHLAGHPSPRSEALSQRHKSDPRTVLIKDLTTSSLRSDDDEEDFAVLKAAIAHHADGHVWEGTTPYGQLRRVARVINGQMASALQVIERMGKQGTRAPSIYVSALAELLDPTGPAGAEILERQRLETRLASLEGLRSIDERWEREATDIESRLATLGV
jgi:hypothetical protein